jgi:DNA-binding NtrC family response regulator
MSVSTLVLVRPHPTQPHHNHPGDTEMAKSAAKTPPCWVMLLGAAHSAQRRGDAAAAREQARSARLLAMRRALGLEGAEVAKNGLNVVAPVELAAELDGDALAGALARHLADRGIRMPLGQSNRLEVRLPTDLDPALLAAVVEAVSVYPRTDLWIGERRLRSSLRWELRRDQFRAPPPEDTESDLIGTTPAINKVRAKIERYADQPFPVLIIGETGSGKEVVARMLHERSAREGRFMPQNAAQLPPELADSLLFGHRKGAFTGADVDRPGRIREAEGGTFFLDETFNLAPSVQGKLLRALNRVNEGIILVESVGSTTEDVVRARLVVSALGDPRLGDSATGTSAMRMDLFYRVSVGIIRLPPLRQTLDDLPLLCRGLLERLGRPVEVTDDGISVLREYHWPGNIRELQLMLLRALMDAPKGVERLDADHLSSALTINRLPPGALALRLPCNLDLELKRIEVATLRAAMREAGDVHAKAGLRVGMDPKTARNFGRRQEKAEQRLLEMDRADED